MPPARSNTALQFSLLTWSNSAFTIRDSGCLLELFPLQIQQNSLGQVSRKAVCECVRPCIQYQHGLLGAPHFKPAGRRAVDLRWGGWESKGIIILGLIPLLPASVDMLSSDSCPEGKNTEGYSPLQQDFCDTIPDAFNPPLYFWAVLFVSSSVTHNG